MSQASTQPTLHRSSQPEKSQRGNGERNERQPASASEQSDRSSGHQRNWQKSPGTMLAWSNQQNRVAGRAKFRVGLYAPPRDYLAQVSAGVGAFRSSEFFVLAFFVARFLVPGW